MESAVEVLRTSLQYEVVVRADRACFGVLLAVFIPSEALDDAISATNGIYVASGISVTNGVVYSPLPIETLIVCELLDDQIVTLCECALASVQVTFDSSVSPWSRP